MHRMNIAKLYKSTWLPYISFQEGKKMIVGRSFSSKEWVLLEQLVRNGNTTIKARKHSSGAQCSGAGKRAISRSPTAICASGTRPFSDHISDLRSFASNTRHRHEQVIFKRIHAVRAGEVAPCLQRLGVFSGTYTICSPYPSVIVILNCIHQKKQRQMDLIIGNKWH